MHSKNRKPGVAVAPWGGSSLQLLEITKATGRTEVFCACYMNYTSSLESEVVVCGLAMGALPGEDLLSNKCLQL